MSDFLTRLVERQIGTMGTVRPRTPSMFAPPVSRAGEVALPAMEPLSDNDDTSRTSADPIRPIDHGGEAVTQTDQLEKRPIPDSRSILQAAMESRRAEPSPARLIRNTSVTLNQPMYEVPTASSTGPVTVHEQAARTHTGLSANSEDRTDSVPVVSATGMVPPRLVEARHDTARSFTAAPPSLISGAITGRRAEEIHAASTQPQVEVTIGRIEVTAVSAAPDRKRKPEPRRPAMSLEEYLTRRQGGRP